MAKSKVLVEDVVNAAIFEGFNSGLNLFLENINNQLEHDVLIQESGDAYSAFQNLINENISVPAEDYASLKDRMAHLS